MKDSNVAEFMGEWKLVDMDACPHSADGVHGTFKPPTLSLMFVCFLLRILYCICSVYASLHIQVVLSLLSLISLHEVCMRRKVVLFVGLGCRNGTWRV